MHLRAHVVGGKLIINPIRLQQFCEVYDGRWAVIEVKEPERSLSQLRMYRAWLGRVAEQTGNDEEELHEFLLDKCAPRVVAQIAGKKGKVEVEQVKRTSGGHRNSMSKEEMSAYMDKCAMLTSFPLPTPEELEAMGYISNYEPIKKSA